MRTDQSLAHLGERDRSKPSSRHRMRKHDAGFAPMLEAMLIGKRAELLCGFCCRLAVAPLVVQPGHEPERDDSCHRMVDLLREPARVVHGKKSLIGIAEQPAVDCQVIPAAHARIVAAIENICAACWSRS